MTETVETMYGMYRIPPFKSDDIVIDIGMNEGLFTIAACTRGAYVVGFEPGQAAFNKAVENIEKAGFKGSCEQNHAAVWRSDINPDYVSYKDDSEGVRLSLIRDESKKIQVRAISLDSILDKYDSIRFMKVDCEGSEFPILLTSKLLPKVQEIAMEVHRYPVKVGNTIERFDPQMLLEFGPKLIAPEGLWEHLQNLGFDGEHILTQDPGLSFIYCRNKNAVS